MFDTPDAVEAAYYRAFETSDLDAMMALWAESEDVVCMHPVGGAQQRGYRNVIEGWMGVFSRELNVRIRLHNVVRIQSDDIAVHSGQEHVERLDGGEGGVVNVTNVYRRTENGWKMVLHHASEGPCGNRETERAIHGAGGQRPRVH